MERMQAIHRRRVAHDLSESGVTPLTIAGLPGDDADAEYSVRNDFRSVHR